MTPGRSCPLSYRYGREALATRPSLSVDTLWIAGGLYGNPFALEALLGAYGAEPGAKALVFNGDFHWFDIDPRDFARVNEAVLASGATRGNVETELARPQAGAGCGCGYPDWVDEGTVERSNRILDRLRTTARAFPAQLDRLARLAMHLVARVGDARVAIVHGDADSLAGWSFSYEALATDEGLRDAEAAIRASGADVIASSHTCLPVLRRFGDRALVNNGAAGMPNFRGELYGLATRIAVSPARESVYGARLRGVFVDAVPIRYDATAWKRRFLEQWPEGSDAHDSYFERIAAGPDLTCARRGSGIPRASQGCRGTRRAPTR